MQAIILVLILCVLAIQLSNVSSGRSNRIPIGLGLLTAEKPKKESRPKKRSSRPKTVKHDIFGEIPLVSPRKARRYDSEEYVPVNEKDDSGNIVATFMVRRHVLPNMVKQYDWYKAGGETQWHSADGLDGTASNTVLDVYSKRPKDRKRPAPKVQGDLIELDLLGLEEEDK